MKNILLVMIILLFTAASVYCGEFEDTRKKAKQGHAVAQYNLGVMYVKGDGVTQDYKQAVYWFTKSAEQGDVWAQFNLDNMYDFGQGVPQDYKQAMYWYKKSAEQGKDGYILTCLHVVQDAARIGIYMGGKMYPASLVRSDFNNDLAILKINGSLPALAFSQHRSAKMGKDVFTAGHPNPGLQGVSAKYTKGAISSLTGIQDDLRLYQISVPIQPGNSGDALLDENGNILGVVIATLNAKKTFEISGSLPQNVNYAVKSLYAQAMIDTMPEVVEKLLAPSKSKSDAIDNAQQSTMMVVSYD